MSTASILTPQVSEVAERFLWDFPFYARVNLKVKSKTRAIVPFVLHDEQLIMWESVRDQMRRGEPVRQAYLKPRQIGSSTFCQGISWWQITTVPNTNALTLAHEIKTTRRIIEMADVFYDYMPVKPMRRFRTKSEFVLENPDELTRATNPGLRSRIEMHTAGKVGGGRGPMNHILHCSEISSWPFPEEIWTAFSQSVPYSPGTFIFLESTALGGGDWWHEFYQDCKRPTSAFRALFIPWFIVKEYCIRDPILVDRYMTKKNLDFEEKRLVRKFKVSQGQLAWRRYKIQEDFKGNDDGFRKEYPAEEEDAWSMVGNPIFDVVRLKRAYDHARPPAMQGYLDGGIRFKKDDTGPIAVYHKPTSGRRYMVGADVALGVPKGDYSCAVVLDVDDEVCAVWWGHVDPITFAHELEKIGRYYNNATVAVEIESIGYATMAELKLTYWNQFRWRHLDRVTEERTNQIGWVTNAKTKHLIEGHMANLIKEGEIAFNDKDLIQEFLQYVENPDGRHGAMPPNHDDRVMACMIAAWCNHLDRPKGNGGRVILPHEYVDALPASAKKDPDFALSHDMGQHLLQRRRDEDGHDWRYI